jgi:hypothetical protein
MVGVVEAQDVAAFAFDALLADATFSGLVGGRVYRDQVPAQAALPAATVAVVSSVDAVTLGGNRTQNTVLIDVRVVTSGASYGPINAAADRADAVLDGLGGVQGGVRVVKLRRDQGQLFMENESGQTHVHIIQTYRTEAHAL